MITPARACVFLMILLSAVPDRIGAAPLAQGNRFPLMFMVMTPEPERPDLPESRMALSLDTDYTSVFVNKRSDRWSALVDMEIGTVTPGFELRLGKSLSLGYRLPLIGMTAGFLDGPLADYHDAGSFPDYGRSLRPENEFAYAVEKDGLAWVEPETGGLRPADSRLNLKYAFYSRPDSAATLMLSIKLPTGDANNGLGSGHSDQGLFLLTRLSRGSLTGFLNPGLIFPHDPDTLGAAVGYRTMACLFIGAEYRISETWGLNAQLNTFTSPLSDTGIDTLDRPCVELGLGFSRRIGRGGILSFSFNEDLSGPAPDFTVRAGIRYDAPLL